jgi:uncharacterized membrane protein
VKNVKAQTSGESPIDLTDNSSETERTKAEVKAPVTVTVPQEAKAPLASHVAEAGKVLQEQKVQVEPHLPDLLAGIAIPWEEEERAKEQKSLDQTIHKLLVIGLAVSVAFMLFGLLLDLTLHRVVPTTIPSLGDIFTRVISLRPSGFLSLGLLVLIATPVVRVIGSFIAFVYERDWGYAGITFLVLLIVTLSIILGRG